MENSSREILTYSEATDSTDVVTDENSKNIEPFIYQNISYSDKRVVEKLEKIEDIKRKINSKKIKGKATYMSLFI